MNRILNFYIAIFLISSTNVAHASNYGTSGIINIPSSRMLDDGVLGLSFSDHDLSSITNITYQATPWLQTTFRYTYGFAKDRSYSAKFRVMKEGLKKPEISIGIKDLFGTGLFGSEYIVASKKINNFDVSLGLGWGRLSERNSIKNPLINLSNSFEGRSNNSEVGGIYGGKLRSTSFFKGPDAGVFGGFIYQIPKTKFRLLAEYNTDSYIREFSTGLMSDNSPLSYGIQWNGLNGLALNLHYLRGNEIGFLVTSSLDTKKLSQKNNDDPFYSAYDGYELSNAPNTLDLKSWYDRLLFDFEKSGLLLRSAKIEPDSNSVTIELSNFRYNLSADAVKKALSLAQIHLPNNINRIGIILNENGYKANIIEFSRNDFTKKFIAQKNISSIKISPSTNINNVTNITKFRVPHINFDSNIATKFQIFDPDKPLKHQVFLKIGVMAGLTQTWNLIGSYAVDLHNNFDTNRPPSSSLEHVRTDINKYLVDGRTGIESLYLEKKSTLHNQIYYRFYAGILETMYSGIGIEALYQPYKSRIAVGGSLNYLYKRGYKRNFELLDYRTSTGFLSIYYASPFYNYDLALHLGRYLAKDKGATFEVRRTFDNGFSVGGFATFTNVSAADFGEGSFDKGLFFKIPFDAFSVKNTKAAFSTVIRSLQRDGGQRLEDFSGRLWHDLRNVRYDSLKNNKDRMMSK